MSAEEPDLVSRNKVPFRQTAGSWRRRDLAGRRPGRGGGSQLCTDRAQTSVDTHTPPLQMFLGNQ